MKRDELLALLLAAHGPDLYKKVGHLIQLWDDGEITSQKCGPLFGQRNLHMLYPPFMIGGTDLLLPIKKGKNSCIYVTDSDKAVELRGKILDYVREALT